MSGSLQFSIVAAAACLAGACFPSFDGLSGGKRGDEPAETGAAIDVAAPDVAAPDAASVVVEGTEVLEDASIPSTSGAADAGGDEVDGEAGVVMTCATGCPGKAYCKGSECVYASCKERKASAPTSSSGVYWIDPDLNTGDPPFLAYCAMNVSDGGWTMLMKADGNKNTFAHDSPLWENADTYQPSAPGYDLLETKLASYSSLPFANLLVGIRVGTTTRFALLAIGGSSLRDLMATGFHPSALGRAGWETISMGSLQTYCNYEGVNVSTPKAAARLGIVSNENTDCNTCDSFVGFGGWYMDQNSYSCGNLALWSPDHGDRHSPLFGYILAR